MTIQLRDFAAVLSYIQSGGDLDILQESMDPDEQAVTALIAAIKKGDIVMIKRSLLNQVDPSSYLWGKPIEHGYPTRLSAIASVREAPTNHRIKIKRMVITIDRLWDSINPDDCSGSRNKPAKMAIKNALNDLEDEMRNNDVDQFWRTFPYGYRKSGLCEYYYFDHKAHVNLLKVFQRDNQSDTEDIESDDLYSDSDDAVDVGELTELLQDVTIKKLRTLTQGKEPSAVLRNLLENCQFGDTVDVIGYRGHGMFVLGFGDLPLSAIKTAVENGTEREHLKLLKTFDYGDEHWFHTPMEVGDAPCGYYMETNLCGNNYRWLDPLRIDFKGQIWKDCMLDMKKYQQSGDFKEDPDNIFPDDYVYINWRGQYDWENGEWTPKRTFLKSTYDYQVYLQAGVAAYCTRYDAAAAMRRDRISQFIMDVWPLEAPDICRLLISFLI